MKHESFSYTPIELAESMTGTAHDTINYLYRKGYIKDKDYEHLVNTIAVYPLPNRKGYGKRMIERLFGTEENESAFTFPIVEIAPDYTKPKPRASKPKLHVVEGDFGKDKKESDG